MQINREASNKYTIQSYSESQITVNNENFHNSIIIGRDVIVSPWPIHSMDELNEITIKPLLALMPEIIIIGQSQLGAQCSAKLIHYLGNQRIGVECMSIGAASRTFNVLLGEGRAVVVGIILPER